MKTKIFLVENAILTYSKLVEVLRSTGIDFCSVHASLYSHPLNLPLRHLPVSVSCNQRTKNWRKKERKQTEKQNSNQYGQYCVDLESDQHSYVKYIHRGQERDWRNLGKGQRQKWSYWKWVANRLHVLNFVRFAICLSISWETLLFLCLFVKNTSFSRFFLHSLIRFCFFCSVIA